MDYANFNVFVPGMRLQEGKGWEHSPDVANNNYRTLSPTPHQIATLKLPAPADHHNFLRQQNLLHHFKQWFVLHHLRRQSNLLRHFLRQLAVCLQRPIYLWLQTLIGSSINSLSLDMSERLCPQSMALCEMFVRRITPTISTS